MSEITNARITSTKFGIDRGFLLTFWVTVEAGGMGQSVGGYCLATDSKPDGHGVGFRAILNLLNVVGVESWEQLKGQLVRVEWRGGPGSARPPRIGHILDNKWWDIEVEMGRKGTDGPVSDLYATIRNG